jgi:nucleoside-diphosphate-sugar epimerase
MVKNKKNAVVFGGSGLIGQEIIKKLIQLLLFLGFDNRYHFLLSPLLDNVYCSISAKFICIRGNR